jgi:hypothetical protein
MMPAHNPLSSLTWAAMFIILVSLVWSASRPAGEFVISPWRSSSSGWKPDTLDRGIGILTFARQPGGIITRRDTISAYQGPSNQSSSVGHFLFWGDNKGWSYAIACPDSLQPNIIEFSYEACGLPFDTITPNGGWARGILGFTSSHEVVRGWVKLDPHVTSFVHWQAELARHSLFFLTPNDPQFYKQPNGSLIHWKRLRSQRDYIMYPIKVAPPWMYVRVVSPDNQCFPPEDIQLDSLRAWIQFLDASGRPAVWYYSRGC